MVDSSYNQSQENKLLELTITLNSMKCFDPNGYVDSKICPFVFCFTIFYKHRMKFSKQDFRNNIK